MLEKIAAVFPRRPLSLAEPGGKFFRRLSFALLFLSMAALGGGMIVWMAYDQIPGIQRDFEIAKDAEPFDPMEKATTPYLRKTQAITGKCSTRGFLVDCKTRLNYIAANGAVAHLDIDFSLIDFHFGDYEAAPVRSASHPEMMTIDLAIDTLWQRVFFVVFMISVGILLILLAPFTFLSNRKIERQMQALSGKTLHPVLLRKVKQNKGYVFYVFDAPSGEKKCKALFWKQKPLMLGDSEALGVSAPGSDYACPLDDGLQVLNLTDAERMAIVQAIEGNA